SLFTSQPLDLSCAPRHIGPALTVQGNRDRDRRPLAGNRTDVTATTKHPGALRHSHQTETSPDPAVSRPRYEPATVIPDHDLNNARVFSDRHCSFRSFRVFRHVVDALLNNAEDVDLGL